MEKAALSRVGLGRGLGRSIISGVCMGLGTENARDLVLSLDLSELSGNTNTVGDEDGIFGGGEESGSGGGRGDAGRGGDRKGGGAKSSDGTPLSGSVGIIASVLV